MGSQNQGGCFVVLGILMIVAGLMWWLPFAVMGVIFLICGISQSSKSKKRAAQQATPTYTQQPAQQQPVSQPAQLAPVQEQPPAIARYCPDCGAPVEGTKFCPLCGKEI